MRRILSSIVIVAVATGPTLAEPILGQRQPQPAPTTASRRDGSAQDAAARDTAQARQEALDRRIARSSRHAINAICAGCAGRSAPTRFAVPNHAAAGDEPSATAYDGNVIDDPAEARLD